MDHSSDIEQAPFLESGIPWDMAINPQENCIILTSGIFENPIISGKIFGFLGQDHLAVSALTRSCQRFAQLYQDEVEHWDITHGYFSNCDVTRPTVDELRKDEKAFRNQASVKSRVVVTQIRGEAISYEKQVTNIYRLGKSKEELLVSMTNRARSCNPKFWQTFPKSFAASSPFSYR